MDRGRVSGLAYGMTSFFMLKAAMPLVYILAGLTLATVREVEHPAHVDEVPLENHGGAAQGVPVPERAKPAEPADERDE